MRWMIHIGLSFAVDVSVRGELKRLESIMDSIEVDSNTQAHEAKDQSLKSFI